MKYWIAANLIVVIHLLFVLFVFLGGFLVLRWNRLAWFHLPVAGWGALIEFRGWICPLTPLEKYFWEEAGEAGYSGGFINHYIIPLIYPAGITPATQRLLGWLVLVVTGAIYTTLIIRKRRRAKTT